MAAWAGLTVAVSGIHLRSGSSAQLRLGSTLTSGSVKFVNVVDQSRISGADRYDTASKTIGDDEQTASVVLSSGEGFADALSATYLTTGKAGGLLLTKKNSLPDVTKATILQAQTCVVYITGGTAAVSQHVENQITALKPRLNACGSQTHVKTVRIFGANRYKTNKAINDSMERTSHVVLLAAGGVFADAVAMSPISFAMRYPLILTDGHSLTVDQTSQLDSLGAKTVVIAGGTSSVSTDVEDQLKARGLTVARVTGGNRVETAANIARWATVGLKEDDGTTPVSGILGTSLGFSSDYTFVTNGASFADALSFGPRAGASRAPLLLSSNPSVPGDGLISYVGDKLVGVFDDGTGIHAVNGVGGVLATTPAMLQQVVNAIQK